MTIMEQINEGIKEGMRSKDQLRLEVLRMLKSKVLTVDARGNLSDAEIQKLFKTYLGSLQESLEYAKTAQRPELIEKLNKEINIVQEFLPKALSVEETKKIVAQAIVESGAKTKKDLGLVMKIIMKNHPAIDGKMAKDLIAQELPE